MLRSPARRDRQADAGSAQCGRASQAFQLRAVLCVTRESVALHARQVDTPPGRRRTTFVSACASRERATLLGHRAYRAALNALPGRIAPRACSARTRTMLPCCRTRRTELR